MPNINDVATDGRPSQTAANLGKMAGICFATMGSGVRTSPGPPSNPIISNTLQKIWGGELGHGVQPWGRSSEIFIKRPEGNCLALARAIRTDYIGISLPFSCPLMVMRESSLANECGVAQVRCSGGEAVDRDNLFTMPSLRRCHLSFGETQHDRRGVQSY